MACVKLNSKGMVAACLGIGQQNPNVYIYTYRVGGATENHPRKLIKKVSTK